VNPSDLAVGLGAALAGFGLVWWLLTVLRQQKRPPLDIRVPPARGDAPRLSVSDLGSRWHTILGVSADASSADIEAAYHARLAACDRVRFAADETPLARQAAESTRAQVNEAYEFIRPARG
jgi:hypothetical protein